MLIEYKNTVAVITSIDDITYSDFYLTLKKLKGINDLRTMSYRRRREFIYGRVCVGFFLNMLGYDNMPIPIINFDKTPKWPLGLVGSISHTHDMVAVCITTPILYKKIGIDIEEIMNKEQSNAVKKLILNEDEFFENRPKSMQKYSVNLYTTIVFSAKESIYKAIYQSSGMYFDLKKIHLIDVDNELIFKIKSEINEEWYENKIMKVYFNVFNGLVLTLFLSE